MPELQIILMVVNGILVPLVVYIMNSISNNTKTITSLRQDFENARLEGVKTYATREELQSVVTELKNSTDKAVSELKSTHLDVVKSIGVLSDKINDLNINFIKHMTSNK